MEPEKTIELESEATETIEIIDPGMAQEDIIGPRMFCCWGTYSPFRI